MISKVIFPTSWWEQGTLIREPLAVVASIASIAKNKDTDKHLALKCTL